MRTVWSCWREMKGSATRHWNRWAQPGIQSLPGAWLPAQRTRDSVELLMASDIDEDCDEA